MATKPAFPYTNPYTNPYTQKKTQPTSSQSRQQKLEYSLSVLVRSSNVPSTQNIEHLCGLVEQCINDHSQNPQCWSLAMAESLAKFVVKIFGVHENINMTGRNPEGYPSTLCFLARSLEQWSINDSVMYTAVVKEFEVAMDHGNNTVEMSLLEVLHNLVVHYNDPIIQNPAMMGLSIIWRYLDRIQSLTSWKNPTDFPACFVDSAWWIGRGEETLANLALKATLRYVPGVRLIWTPD